MLRINPCGSAGTSGSIQRRTFVSQGLALLSASCCAAGHAAELQRQPVGDERPESQAVPADSAASTMRVALGQFSAAERDLLKFIKQCGVDDVILNTAKLPGEERWELPDVLELKRTVEDAGLRIAALENVPRRFYDRIMLGESGRDAQLENMRRTVHNVGEAGINLLGYHFMPNGVWRTSTTEPVRGGALATAFDMAQLPEGKLSFDRVYTEEQMWQNYDWYLERILPSCEQSGVRLALHPDDPPVAAIGGVARLFRNFENFKRAMDTFNSPMHGLDFCVGCWSEMNGGAGVIEAIRHFGRQEKICYVHLRDVQGNAEKFTECWCGEGNLDMLAVLRELKAVGFRGVLIPDHVPRMTDDSPWCHRGRAYTVGYMKGLLQAL